MKGGVNQELGSGVGNVYDEVRATDVLHDAAWPVVVCIGCELTKAAVKASGVPSAH